MEAIESRGRNWLAMLMMVLGVGAVTSTTIPHAPIADGAEKSPAARDRSEQTTAAAAGSSGEPYLRHLRPVMKIMGDTLGVSGDPAVDEAVEGGLLLHRHLCSLPTRSKADRQALDACDALLDMLAPAALAQHKHEVRSQEPRRAWAVNLLSAYAPKHLATGSEADRGRGRLIEYSKILDLDRRTLKRLQGAASSTRIRFLVATIADYVDSNIGWYTDQQLDAIQGAMGEVGFVLDRFTLPDWPLPADPDKVALTRAHEQTPGAIVFRRFDPDQSVVELWVVLLVAETPTIGVQREALHNAFRFAKEWDPFDCEDSRLLGPTFSGSAVSLREVLSQCERDKTCPRVKVVTGSANADENQRVIVGSAETRSFASMTHPFGTMLAALSTYFRRTNPAWANGERMAVLVENNTTFGSLAASHSIDAPRGSLPQYFPRAVQIPFPMHISRLRQASGTPSGGSVSTVSPLLASAARALIPLNLRDARPPVDQLPPLTPEVTAASVQTTVTSIFEAIRREQFGVIGIVATDERDTTYLARELRRAAPDAQLFLLGQHRLFLHPEFASYMRGSLAVSSYPLNAGVQQGIGARNRLRQFQSANAEGMYNATLALMGEAARLVDYRDPDRTALPARPAVWISAIGQHDFVPLMFYSGENPSYEYANQSPQPTTSAFQRDRSLVSPMLWGLVCLFLSVVLWHVWAIVRQFRFDGHRQLLTESTGVGLRKAMWRARYVADRDKYLQMRGPLDTQWNTLDEIRGNWIKEMSELRVTDYHRVFALPWQPRARRHTSHALIYAAFGLLGLVASWLLAVVWMAMGWTPDLSISLFGLAIAVVPPTVLFITGWWSRRQSDQESVLHEMDTSTHSYGLMFAMILAVLIGALHFYVRWIPIFPFTSETASGQTMQAFLFANRNLTLENFLSPTVPLVFFSLIAYTWVRWQLDCLSQSGSGYAGLFEASSTSGDTSPTAVTTADPPTQTMAVGVGNPRLTTDGVIERGQDAGRPTPLLRPIAAPLRQLQHSPSEARVPAPTESDGSLSAGQVEMRGSMTDLLLNGDPLRGGPRKIHDVFARVADMSIPTREHWKPLGVALGATLLLGLLVLPRVSTVESAGFTWLFRIVTAFCFVLAMLALGHTLMLWHHVHAALVRLGRSSFAPSFTRVKEFNLDWRLKLWLPRRDELTVLMKLSDGLEAVLGIRKTLSPSQVAPNSERAIRERAARELLCSLSIEPQTESLLTVILGYTSQRVRFLDERAFVSVWLRCERYLPALNTWLANLPQLPDSISRKDASAAEDFKWPAEAWFRGAQDVVALSQAFVIRGLLSRVLSGMFVASASLVLLLLAHLLYSFPGRATLLAFDWIALGVTSLLAVQTLVQMERSVVLSHLWDGTPGRLNFNGEFIRRISVYGALPLLTAFSALFPELGDTVFGWLPSVRQLIGL